MLRVTLDRATMELLHSLREPLELCDQFGTLLGTFLPEAGEPAHSGVSSQKPTHHEWEQELGEEINV
jgi:hypothetical protein